MSLEVFSRLEPTLEPGSRLSLFGLGEPLLNPSFVEMLLTDCVARAVVGRAFEDARAVAASAPYPFDLSLPVADLLNQGREPRTQNQRTK